MIIILPIDIAVNARDVLNDLVRYRAFVSDLSYDRESIAIKVVSKMLRATTHYPAGGVAESWAVHVSPRWRSKNGYEVSSVFYGDERLAIALRMNDIPFGCDSHGVVTGDGSYLVVGPGHRQAPFNITVVHGRVSLHHNAQHRLTESQDKIHSSLAREWGVVQDVYEPRSLTALDLKQAELAHRFIGEVQKMGNPTFGLGELYIVDTGTFKQRLRSLEGFGEGVRQLAYATLREFEKVEDELKAVL